jgi:hypothetical protein
VGRGGARTGQQQLACVFFYRLWYSICVVCLSVACDHQLYLGYSVHLGLFGFASLSLRLRCEGPNAGGSGFGGDMRAGLLRSPQNMQARAISILSCVGRRGRVYG